VSDSDNENYYQKWIGKLGAEELARLKNLSLREEPLYQS
jgi:hypothetical protein